MTPNIDLFKEKLEGNLDANLPAKELAENIVIAVLESEYGKSFTLNPGFAKMVKTLADGLVTNPELRRQALSVASVYNKKNRERQKDIPKRDQSIPSNR